MDKLPQDIIYLITMFILEHGAGQHDHNVWRASKTFKYWATNKALIEKNYWGLIIGHESRTSNRIIVYPNVLEQYKKQVSENDPIK